MIGNLPVQDAGTPHKKKECTNVKQLFITEVEQSLLSILDNAQMKALHEALTHALWEKNIVAVDSAVGQPKAQSNTQLLEMFLSAKCVEDCSEKTLHYYQTSIAKLLHILDKRVVHHYR